MKRLQKEMCVSVAAALWCAASAWPQAAITVVEPNGGEQYVIGDTMHIRYVADSTRVPQVVVQFSFDGGDLWVNNMFANGLRTGTVDTSWVIPSFVVRPPHDTISTVSTNCLMEVSDYTQVAQPAQSAGTFTILAKRPSPPPNHDNTGCGAGAGAALIPPLFFKLTKRKRCRGSAN